MRHQALTRIAAGAAVFLALGCAPAAVPPAANPSTSNADAVPAGLAAGEHEVVRDGVRMWYRVGGSAPADAPPVVFLHGGPGQGSAHFDALAGPAMERNLRMVYFDQRGAGHSDRPASNDYAIATLVEDIEALRQALGAPKIALLGHSFGGLLALEYAAKYPERVSHVVFVAGLWDIPIQCRWRFQTVADRRPEAYARVRADTLNPDGTVRHGCHMEFLAFPDQAEREAYFREAMYPDASVAARIDSVEAAHGVRNTGEIGRALFGGGELFRYRFTGAQRLTMPVLVVAGRHDGAARPEGLRELAARLPNARFVEFDRSGHFVYLDETERFAREVAAFVRGER